MRAAAAMTSAMAAASTAPVRKGLAWLTRG
jgi:hypothetical protein